MASTYERDDLVGIVEEVQSREDLAVNNVFDAIFPSIAVNLSVGDYGILQKENTSFVKNQDIEWKPGTAPKRVRVSFSGAQYNCVHRAFGVEYTDDEYERFRDQATNPDDIVAHILAEQEITAKNVVAQRVLNRLNRVTAGGAWSNPQTDIKTPIQTANDAIRTRMGKNANILVCSERVFEYMINNEDFTSSITPTTAITVSPREQQRQSLQAYLGIDEIRFSSLTYEAINGDNTAIFDNSEVYLLYNAPVTGPLGALRFGFGANFAKSYENGSDFRIRQYERDSNGRYRWDQTAFSDWKVTGADFAQKITIT